MLADREEHTRSEENGRRYIPIDAPVDLPYDNPIARARRRRSVRRDDLHELPSALGDRARADGLRRCSRCCATCSTSCRRTRRSARSSTQRTASARSRTTCGASRCSSGLPKEFIDYLRVRVELIRYSPGEVIVRQGDPADCVLSGAARVREGDRGASRRRLVLAYIPRGGYFGEMGLLGGGVRTATCTALDHVELSGSRRRLPHDASRRSPRSARSSSASPQERAGQNRHAADDDRVRPS